MWRNPTFFSLGSSISLPSRFKVQILCARVSRDMSSSSQFGPETLTLAMADDDDDFQNPCQAISLSQNLILSSLTNSTSKPLKLSHGARPRKKPKPSAATGKENYEMLQTPDFDSGGCYNYKQKRNNGVQEKMWTPSSPIKSTPEEVPLTLMSGSVFSVECTENDGIKRGTCSVSTSVGTKAGEIKGTRVPSSRVPDDCCPNKGLKAENGSYSISIESRLLGSRTHYFPGGENGCLEEDNTGDFEPGTQLNKLMDLCSEMVEENTDCVPVMAERNDIVGEDSVMQEDHLVECPLCCTDITKLAEEMRQVHTNDCLDKADTTNVTVSSLESEHISPQPQTDVSPVLEWLRMLGLSRYEEAFVKEEIDWETLQWLTEEDLVSLGIVALGPRKKIVHSLTELRKRSSNAHDKQSNAPSYKPGDEMKLSPGNKLITEYFDGPVGRNSTCISPKVSSRIEIANKKSCRRRATATNSASNGNHKDIPSWCCIPGTPFRVDAFRYLRGDCSHWFLTHFHLDHYQGLTRNFCRGKIYCSSITAHLLNLKIGIPWDKLHILTLNQRICIEGVNLTCFDANHCPGSLIILFEPPNGKAVLHTGDFRFCAEMASSSVLQSCSIHTLILDTTYCNPQYDFPKQEAVIQFVIEAIQAEAFNPKTLFLIGSYTIGKERLFLEVARVLRKKVYVGAAKLRLLQCLGLPKEDMHWFTPNEIESQIHVVPMWSIASFKRMKHISNLYSDRYDLIVAFSPTGWTFGKGKRKTHGRRWQQGTIIRYEVPYSEHSSFTELREFVEFVSPENIIPSVNNNSPECADAMVALLMSDA